MERLEDRVALSITVGGITFDDTAFADALVSSAGEFSVGGGAESLPGAVTGSVVSDYAFSFSPGAQVVLGFTDNTILNGPGPDVAIFELGVPDSFLVSFPDGTAASVIGSSDTGEDAGEYDLNVALVDLSAFGFAEGATVSQIILGVDIIDPVEGSRPSLTAVAAINSRGLWNPGDVFSDVLLPDVRLPLAAIESAQVDLHLAPLELDFTVRSPGPGVEFSAESDIGSLQVSIQVSDGDTSVEIPIATSTTYATVDLIAGPSPTLNWSTPGFLISSTTSPPVEVSTGPISDSVSLASLGLDYPGASFETIIRTAEAYFHQHLSGVLFGWLTNHIQFAKPGASDLLLTAPGGRQTGLTAAGDTVNDIPFSAYVPSYPLVIVAAPDPGPYRLNVRARESGDSLLVTALSEGPRVLQQQAFAGTIAAGQALVYSATVGVGSLQAGLDVEHSLEAFPSFIDYLEETGGITSPGIANSLRSKISRALSEFQAGRIDSARRLLVSFINQASSQSGRRVTEGAADSLIAYASLLLGEIA
ncbi:MAG: hypothetical protein U0790_02300 [Isosphaeraceae bacterium]